MANFEVPENPKYETMIRKFEPEDEAHADLFNSVVQALVNNDSALKKEILGKSSTGHTHAAASTSSPGFMQAADKRKLDGIDENANNYTHPSSHPASMITQDATHRFVTDAEKQAWDALYAQLVAYTDGKIADLIGGAPATLDTLKEIADAIAANKSTEQALNEAIGKKANQAELDTHTGNATIHVTATDKAGWDKAMGERTVTFTQAGSRVNITSGEKLSTILGKVRKFFTDLKTVAFTGSYNDLSDKPEAPVSLPRAADASDAARKVWFDSPDATDGEGRLAYDEHLSYNPAKNILEAGTFKSQHISTRTVTFTGPAGWKKVAKVGTAMLAAGSCIIDIKRQYHNSNNEYHRVALLCIHGKYEFAPVMDKSNVQVITKARLVMGADGGSFIEVYYSIALQNPVTVTVENAIVPENLDDSMAWEVAGPEGDTEIPAEGSVAATFDIPADFHAGMLVRDDYLKEHFVPGYVSSKHITFTAPAGWKKVAELNDPSVGNNSCAISIKREYATTNNEVHRLLLLTPHKNHEFAPVADKSNYQAFTKIRVVEGAGGKSYLEVYYSVSTSNRATVSIEDAQAYYSRWKVLASSINDTETPESGTVSATYDILANFNNKMLALRDEAALKSIYGDNAVSLGREAGTAVGNGSFAFGGSLEASGEYAHAEGNGTKATGFSSHAEGSASDGDVVSSGVGSHAEGVSTVASNNGAHAEGGYTSASGEYAHAEGSHANAIGRSSHAGGGHTYARGDYSHAGGYEVRASNYASCAVGKYNYDRAETGGAANSQIGDAFIVGNGVSTGGYPDLSNAFRVTYAGDVYGKKAFNASGADFAEWHEFADGNPDNEDRVGYFVTLAGDGKIRIADGGDYILGIVSGNPCVVGNADEDYYWKYERDGFNRIVMEDVPETVQKTEEVVEAVQDTDPDGNPLFDGETGEPVMVETKKTVPVFDGEGYPVMVETGKVLKNARMKLAESYDPSLQETYMERKYRKEWCYVGKKGQVPVRDDGTCIPGQFCKCGDGGVATISWERGFDTYMVAKRISPGIVLVEL